MKWSRGWYAAAALALAGVILAIYLNLASDDTSQALLQASAQEGQTRLIGMAIGATLSLAVCFLAFVMFETNLFGNFIVILICAAWILRSCFLG